MSHLINLRLKWFSKKDERLIKDEISSINLEFVRDVLRIDSSYDFYVVHSYDVTDTIATELQSYYQHQIDLNLYDYSVCSSGKNT